VSRARGDTLVYYAYDGTLVAAVHAIAQGWGGNAQALAHLWDRAINDMVPVLRVWMVVATVKGWTGDAYALDLAWDRTNSEPDPYTRITMMISIVMLWDRSTQVEPFLRGCAVNDPELSVREVALQALAAMQRGNLYDYLRNLQAGHSMIPFIVPLAWYRDLLGL